MKKIVISLIRFYKKTQAFHLAPLASILGIRSVCRFTPTCSEYMIEAVEKYGVLKGIYLGILRIGRCSPFFKAGYDPVK